MSIPKAAAQRCLPLVRARGLILIDRVTQQVIITPMAKNSWKHAPSRPWISYGDMSAEYIGISTVAAPMPGHQSRALECVQSAGVDNLQDVADCEDE